MHFRNFQNLFASFSKNEDVFSSMKNRRSKHSCRLVSVASCDVAASHSVKFWIKKVHHVSFFLTIIPSTIFHSSQRTFQIHQLPRRRNRNLSWSPKMKKWLVTYHRCVGLCQHHKNTIENYKFSFHFNSWWFLRYGKQILDKGLDRVTYQSVFKPKPSPCLLEWKPA